MAKKDTERATREEKFINTISSQMCGFLMKYSNDDYYGPEWEFVSKTGRAVGDALTVAHGKWSRLVTPNALQAISEGCENHLTYEHPHSKQQMGVKFVQYVIQKDRPPHEHEILKFLDVANVTIKSLKTENYALAKHQNDDNVNGWAEAYQRIGIDALYYVDPSITFYNKAIKNNKLDGIDLVTLEEADDLLKQGQYVVDHMNKP